LKQSHWYTITYSLRTYHLLESPYPTDCINYHKNTEYLSRRDCKRKCMIRRSLSKCNVIFEEINVFKWENNIRFANTTDEIKCSKNLDLNQYCSRNCSHMDCIKTYYKPVFLTNDASEEKEIRIDWVIPFEPETIFWHKPRIELIEFLCYIAAILSLWFGFSILSIYFWLNKLIDWIKSKYSMRDL